LVINQAGESTRVVTNVTVLSPSTISSLPIVDTTTSDDIINERTIIVVEYILNITDTLLQDQTLIGDSSSALQIVQILSNMLNTEAVITSTTSNVILQEITEIRDDFLQIIVFAASTATPEQVAVTLQTVTQTNGTTVILTLDVAQQLLDRLLNGDGNTNGGGSTTVNGNGVTQNTIVDVISNVLNVTDNCTNIARATTALTSVINVALSDTIANEAATTISSSNVIISGTRTSSSSSSSSLLTGSSSSSSSTTSTVAGTLPTIVTIGGSNVVISSEATSNADIDDSTTSDENSYSGNTNNNSSSFLVFLFY
jgi:hypothetical protein